AVSWCLAHRRITVLGAAVFFIASVALVPLISSGLVPPAGRGYTTVDIELPPGSSLQNTFDVAEAARAAVAGGPGIRTGFTTIGDSQRVDGSAQQAGEVRKGALTLTLAARSQRDSQVVIERAVRQKLLAVAGGRFTIGSGGVGEKMQLIL